MPEATKTPPQMAKWHRKMWDCRVSGELENQENKVGSEREKENEAQLQMQMARYNSMAMIPMKHQIK